MKKFFRNTRFWLLLCLTGTLLAFAACSTTPTGYTPPMGFGPQAVFVVERDYKTTWNALVRAVEQMPHAEIWYKAVGEGKMTLRDTEIPVLDNCQCGTVGASDLRGIAERSTTIDVAQEAPQLTRIRIQCAYTLPFSWPNAYGRDSRQQRIDCLSSGRFEQDLYERTMEFLGS